MEAEHAPGCEGRHTARQACRVAQTSEDSPQDSVDELQPIAQRTTRAPTGRLVFGCVQLPLALFAVLVLFVASWCSTLFLPWFREPPVIRASEPEGAHRVYATNCCGGNHTADPWVVDYGTSMTLDEVFAHYENALHARGWRGEEFRSATSMGTGSASDPMAHFRQANFTRAGTDACIWLHSMDRGPLWSLIPGDKQRELAQFATVYEVTEFPDGCAG